MTIRPHAVGLLAAALTSNLAAAQATGSSVLAEYDLNAPLRSYTFHMDVAMSMRHFPWLHFHMNGDGVYQRGNQYRVTFTGGPPFMPQRHDVDLSILDPSMWPGRYRYAAAGQQNGDTIFALEDASNTQLKSGTVALNPSSGIRWVDATYDDGTHVHMTVTSNDALGYLLPSSIQATVDYPHMPVAADATFTNYTLPH
ncbi:MAG TPA: hypothetical protein VMF61_15120 [Candidatus Acidoferrales bacterium]|nr:hypothetical protein [Candidatus Acidoferrales bacterium]